MSTDPKILGFSNKWYVEGIENKISRILPNGTEIFIFPPEYYIAVKFEAHKSRGGKDLRQSHDFEDIIYIIDNCPNLMDDIANANESVKTFLKQECISLMENNYLIEGIESVLPFGSDSDSTEKIQDIIQSIAELE